MEGLNFHRIASNLEFNYGDISKKPEMTELQNEVEKHYNGDSEAFDKILKLLSFDTETRFEEIKTWLQEEFADTKNLEPTPESGDYDDEEEVLEDDMNESIKLLSPLEFKKLKESK